MATSSFYKELQKRYKELKKIFIPRHFSPTGSYNDSTYEKVAAYKLLIHAALEYYFEQTALSIAKEAFDKWITTKSATRTIVALVAYYPTDFLTIPEKTNEPKATQDLDYRVKKAYTYYNNIIRTQNHGIKEKNILSIFLPIGITIAEIDNNMLVELDTFGADRGNIAHTTKAKQQVPPEDAEAKISNILNLIKIFDEMLCANYTLK